VEFRAVRDLCDRYRKRFVLESSRTFLEPKQRRFPQTLWTHTTIFSSHIYGAIGRFRPAYHRMRKIWGKMMGGYIPPPWATKLIINWQFVTALSVSTRTMHLSPRILCLLERLRTTRILHLWLKYYETTINYY